MFNRIINIVPTENVDDVTFKLSRPTYFLLFCNTTTHTRGANFALAKNSIVSEAGVRFTCMYSRAQHIIRYVVFVQITSHTIDPPPRTVRSYLLVSGASRVGLASETEVMYIVYVLACVWYLYTQYIIYSRQNYNYALPVCRSKPCLYYIQRVVPQRVTHLNTLHIVGAVSRHGQ